MPNTYVVIVWAAGRPATGRRLVDLLRIVDEGRRTADSSTSGTTSDSELIATGSELSSAPSTLALGHAKLGRWTNTFCFASVIGFAVWTSLLCIKEVMPEVYVNGAAEAVRGGGNVGPASEAVDAGGKEAVDGPALLDGNPFRLRSTVVQGS